MRADVRRLAAYPILSLVSTAWIVVVLITVSILVRIAFNQRRLERR